MTRHLIVMAKPPLAGRAKTRLANDIGPARAASFCRLATGRLLHRLGGDPRWRTHLCVNAGAGEDYACWPTGMPRLRQGGGDLGARMARAMAGAGRGPVVILGTDTPQVEPQDVAEAFTRLGAADAVFGPADDGGYWLIGLARRRPALRLFEGVRWSTEHALADTAASLPSGFQVHYLRTLTDVDDADALRRMRAAWGEVRRGPWAPRSAPDGSSTGGPAPR